MASEHRPLRADAERNRRRLLEAARELFRERGPGVGVGEIAEAAGVGRGTVFRNFPTKEHLIAAIVVETIGDVVQRGRELLDAPDSEPALFEYLGELVGRQQLERAVLEAVTDEWLANPEIRAAHAQLIEVLDQLLARCQATGEVRADVGALDVLMLIKGVCQAASAFAHVDPEIAERQLDLVRSALTAPSQGRALRGKAPTLADLERTSPSPQAEPGTAASRPLARPGSASKR
jgi:AcrR family transcriptional regulator